MYSYPYFLSSGPDPFPSSMHLQLFTVYSQLTKFHKFFCTASLQQSSVSICNLIFNLFHSFIITCLKLLFFISCDEGLSLRRPGEEVETVRRLKIAVAFRMLSSGSREMVPHALQLLPGTKVRYRRCYIVLIVLGSFVTLSFKLFFLLFLMCYCTISTKHSNKSKINDLR